jgi:hypothetical protein
MAQAMCLLSQHHSKDDSCGGGPLENTWWPYHGSSIFHDHMGFFFPRGHLDGIYSHGTYNMHLGNKHQI